MANARTLETLFSIFKYQIPIELHENALYSCLNLIAELKKPQKENLFERGILTPMSEFYSALVRMDWEIMSAPKALFCILDFGIKVVQGSDDSA